MFSILLPTWNNLPLLKLCVHSIRTHSAYDHQIIVHVNDGSDGTLEWVREQGLDHTHSPQNVGICLAVNESAMLAEHDYIVFLNDDMVCCPGWDTALVRRLEKLDTDLFMLSGSMIEPVDTGNPCVVVGDYGRDADTFDEPRLLADVPRLVRGDWYGATWPPTVVHRRWWFKLGGYSSELTPGMSSDNDFSMKLWHAGCRIFLGVGDSLVYHFQCKSTGKVKKNDGRRQFLNKWGLSQSTFDKYFLRRGTPAGADWRLPEPELTSKLRWDLRRNDLSRRLRPGVDVL